MILNVACIWCNTRLDFEKHVRHINYEIVISHSEIHQRLLKSDPSGKEPSDIIISLYIRKLFNLILEKHVDSERVNVAFLFKNLDQETVDNFKDFIESTFSQFELELIIIEREDYPNGEVLSKFNSVKFIQND